MRILPDTIKKATSTGKGKIIASVILIVILGAITGGIVYWNVYKKQIIRNKLDDTIQEKTQGLYTLHYDNLNLDEVAGDLSVSNINLAYDSIKYSSLTGNDKPSILLNIQIPSISVSGVKTPRALLSKEIVGKKIHIKDPVINIIYTNAGKDSSKNVPGKEIYEQVLGDLNLIKVDTVEISGAQITTSNLKTGKKDIHFLNTFIRLTDVAVDSTAAEDKSRMLFSKQIFLTCERFSWPSKNKLYNYTADSISLNTASGSIQVKKFLVDPKLKEDAFVKSLPAQDDRFDFSINNIAIRNVNMQELFNENVVADSILISSSSFKIYRDVSVARDKKNRVGTYPHQVIAEIPVPVQIKKLVLSNSFVEYKEKNPRSNQAGKVQFHNVHATISNLTNRKDVIKENNIMTADISTRFLNKALLKVTWQFYLQHPKGRFDVKGSLGEMYFKDANSITEPMGPARLEDGKLRNLQFNLAGHDYGMAGTVKMLYDDLKVSVLERDKGSKKLDKKTLATIAANIIIKNSNPGRKKDEPRVAEIQMERDTNRSIFSLVWKSLFKGIKETAGIKK
ncbi:MAG: hypothetical protein ABI675_01245 [Chitinophagaceae bacterium]